MVAVIPCIIGPSVNCANGMNAIHTAKQAWNDVNIIIAIGSANALKNKNLIHHCNVGFFFFEFFFVRDKKIFFCTTCIP
jgi:hypothetical protein